MRKILFPVVLLLLASTGLKAQQQQKQRSKPNIVIIISDDHAFQAIGAYGSTYGHTPHIDRIAAQGAVFDRAYVTNSICGPSRAVLLTGKYSHKNGFKDNESSRYDHGQDSFIKQLGSAGYKTAWMGKIHLGHQLEGFTDYDVLIGQGHYFNPDFNSSSGPNKVEGYVSDIVTDKALAWIDKHKEDPFCVVIGHKATHRTWMPDVQDLGRYDQQQFAEPESLFDDYQSRIPAAQQEMTIDKHMHMGYDLKMFDSVAAMRKDGNFARMTDAQFQAYADYYGPIYAELQQQNLRGADLVRWKYQRYMKDYMNTAESMDRNIGRVLDYLEEEQLQEHTLVVYLSDQGFFMGEHGWYDKRWMYEESFRTPLLAMLPGVIPAGVNIPQLVMNVDLAPTFLDLAGVEVPKTMQGHSMRPILQDSTAAIRQHTYYHYFENGEHAVSPHFGISDGRYKLIRYYKRMDAWEFFDLQKDPQELRNTYQSPQYKKEIARLKKALQAEALKLEDADALHILERSF